MFAAEYLARVGFDALVARLGGPAPLDDLRADEDYARAAREAGLVDHARVRRLLIDPDAVPQPRAADLVGAKWLDMVITWPDRVPGLKTWAGQSSLPKILAAHQRRLRESDANDLFLARGAYRTGKNEGPSGLDALCCQDAIDTGFSPAKLGMDVECRPGLELLAILGLETLPLVSFGPRLCGFFHDERLWQFPVEPRDGGYYHRWGEVRQIE